METTDITHIAHLAEICAQRGVRHVVLSPGSRNAPLIIAFDQHPAIKTYLIHDERCAAFFALGIAEALNEPVAVCCTSGSAPLNYSPAIAEAFYRNIPLFVLTADRPVALIDQGDGQTIRQKNVFNNFIKAQFELPDFSVVADLTVSDKTVNAAINELLAVPKGPVHINIPLAEPLYGCAQVVTLPTIGSLDREQIELTSAEKRNIAEEWKSASKKLVLVGQHAFDPRLAEVLQGIIRDPSVAILVENTSNLQHFQKIVHCIDRTLALISVDELDQFKPDLLVTLGGAVVSKKIKAFLRTHKPSVNWRVGRFAFEEDTYCSLSYSFRCDAYDFFAHINALEFVPQSNYGDRWKQKDFIAYERHRQFLDNVAFSDLKAFEWILDTLPENANLHMGNSSVVRYCQLFNPVHTVRYFSNRGVSGIDGSTSTAAGFAVAEPAKLNVLISGDISFFYDSNALWNTYIRANFRIIVINNGGGGIFQILEGSNTVKQAPIFFSAHTADVSGLCRAHDIDYYSADSLASLQEQLPVFYGAEGAKRPAVLEVKTFSYSNAAALKNYFNYLATKK